LVDAVEFLAAQLTSSRRFVQLIAECSRLLLALTDLSTQLLLNAFQRIHLTILLLATSQQAPFTLHLTILLLATSQQATFTLHLTTLLLATSQQATFTLHLTTLLLATSQQAPFTLYLTILLLTTSQQAPFTLYLTILLLATSQQATFTLHLTILLLATSHTLHRTSILRQDAHALMCAKKTPTVSQFNLQCIEPTNTTVMKQY